MATILRSPFYVPSAADPPVWQGGSPRSSQLIRPLLTGVKIYGVGGQAWTKRWLPHYTYDDASVWQWQTPRSTLIEPLLTSVKFYGAGGQAPTKRWQAYYNYDDAAVWFQPFQVRNPNLVTQPFKSGVWEYNHDVSPVWQWQSQRRLTQPQFFGALGQASPHFWRFDYNDAAGWYPQPPATAFLLTGGQARAKPQPWRYDYDSAASWQPFSVRNRNLLDGHGPFSQGGWRFDFAGEPLWQFTSAFNLPLFTPTTTTTTTPTGVGWPQGPGRRRHDPEETAHRIKRQRPFSRKVWEELKAEHAAALAAKQTALAQEIQARLDAELLAQAELIAAREQARGQEDDESRQRQQRQAALDAFAASAGWQRIQGTFAGHPTLDLAALKARLQQQQDEDDEDEAIAMLLLS